ncbi:zf-HC2 domain-containing protein [Streptomyces sp. NPDC096310]|uniref:zf-HC2 domain-containing protein n=1 Tax=Streptomyces sp. NPDC096310 TaxID=3366082 RepID=UPI0037F122C2
MSGETGEESDAEQGVRHASERLVLRYARGDTGIPADQVWALEAHLECCAACRGRLATAAAAHAPDVATLVDGVWSELAPLLPGTAPAPRRRPRHLALASWASPVMVPWLCMTVAAGLLAVFLEAVAPRSLSLVALLAPVLPVFGVAASWARGLDPAYEIVTATPRAGLPLVLRRTTAMLVVVISVLAVAGWLTGTALAQWLLPCLAFTTGTLALGGLIGVTRAATVLVAVWAGGIVAPAVALNGTAFALGTGALPLWGVLFVLGVAVVVARRGAFTVLGAQR